MDRTTRLKASPGRDASVTRRTRPAVTTFLVCVVALACTANDRMDIADLNTLTIGYGGDEYLLGPAQDDTPKFLVFLPLAKWHTACRTDEHTGLAERWEHTPDRRRWTIYLRRDVRWHDGVPVTAHDIAFNIRLWRHPDLAWYGAYGVDSVTVIDDYTVTLFLNRPGTTSMLTWDVYYPKHLLEDLDPKEFFEWDFWTHPIGNGPYRYVRHDRETHIEFEANADYYQGEPSIKRVVITLGSGVSSVVSLLSGNVDVVGLSPREAEPFAQDDRFAVYYAMNNTSPVRLVWNVRHPLFEDKAIRQALTLAIDRRTLAGALGLPKDTPITDGTYSSCQYERRDLRPPWPYDPDAARRTLDAAGWRDTDGDGVRERNGVPFRFSTMVVRRHEPAAVFVQDQLRRIGVRMDVQVLEDGLVVQRFVAGDFEAAIPRLSQLDFRFGRPDAPNGYDNARVRAIVRSIEETDHGEDLERLYRELADIYHDEIPGTYLYPRLGATVARPWVRGLDAPALGGFLGAVNRLWIEANK